MITKYQDLTHVINRWKIDEVTGSKRTETGKGMMTTFGAAERLKAGKGSRAGPGQ